MRKTLLTCLIMLSTISNFAQFTTDGNGIITGFEGTPPVDIIIPSVVNGETITGIGINAFANKQLESVEIEEGITDIGINAFYLNQITYVYLPDGIVTIGDRAFSNNLLTSIEIPENVINIEEAAFRNNKLRSVIFWGDKVNKIGNYAFADNNIKKIFDLPTTITSIGKMAFSNNKITKFVIPEGVTSIEYGILAKNQLTEIEIPSNVINIAGAAFLLNNITEIKIPEGVLNIGDKAFESNLITHVEIPSSLRTIEGNPFEINPIEKITFHNNTYLTEFPLPLGSGLTNGIIYYIYGWKYNGSEIAQDGNGLFYAREFNGIYETITSLKSGSIGKSSEKENNSEINNLFTYPNPFSNIINVQVNYAKSVEVLDSRGSIINSINANSNMITINTNEFSSGVYFVRVTLQNGKIVTNKVVKH